MSWRESCAKQEKLKFIDDWLKKIVTFAELCERYEISRKTGYKLINRFRMEGEAAFEELSRTRHHHPNQIPESYRGMIIDLKIRYPHWGPLKLRDWLIHHESGIAWPAASTIGNLLKRHGMVKPRKRRNRTPAYSEPFAKCNGPNKVWSADFKGYFLLGSGKPCYPLTITDNYSRFLLLCEGLEGQQCEATMKGFRKAFLEYGLPWVIKTDNGFPFASPGIGGLSRLSIWLLKLGIMPERIAPGHPEQNGRHERMHRTLKEEATRPAKNNLREQQRKFDAFKEEYNHERPHQALKGKRPKDVYESSTRSMPNKLPEVFYPDGFVVRKVKTNGTIKLFGNRYYVSEQLHGEPIGLEMIDEQRAVVYFAKLKLGLVDARKDKIVRPKFN